MRTTSKKIFNPADLPAQKWMQLEDQVMERALELWHKKGPAHLNAFIAWSQAEHEIFGQNPKSPPFLHRPQAAAHRWVGKTFN